jgi:hypothetical protein
VTRGRKNVLDTLKHNTAQCLLCLPPHGRNLPGCHIEEFRKGDRLGDITTDALGIPWTSGQPPPPQKKKGRIPYGVTGWGEPPGCSFGGVAPPRENYLLDPLGEADCKTLRSTVTDLRCYRDNQDLDGLYHQKIHAKPISSQFES